jgi:hypothetical protein
MDHRRKGLILLISAFFLFAFTSCGGSSTESAAEIANSYTYDMNQNGCDTGRQSFPDLTSYCAGLENNALNHYCAQSLRGQEFVARGCPGTFTPS